jgi:hypothetical protein
MSHQRQHQPSGERGCEQHGQGNQLSPPSASQGDGCPGCRTARGSGT